MKKTKLENQQQVWKGCKKTTGQTESMAHSENMVCRLSTHRKKPLQFLYPLAELSQCILDSSNGSIINVI